MADTIYLDGRHYDRLFGRNSEDLPFWVAQAQACGGPVLELGCGSGRVAIALAAAGFEVVGLDSAAGMLALAEQKAAAAGLAIEWVAGDMRDFALGWRFKLITLAANSLAHLLTVADLERCLASVRQHLEPAGRFVISYFVPIMEMLVTPQPEGVETRLAEYEDPDASGRVLVTESYVYEPHTQIKRVKLHYRWPAQGREEWGELNLRMYFPQELDALLRYNGLVIEEKYGDYELTPFDMRADVQLVVCRGVSEH